MKPIVSLSLMLAATLLVKRAPADEMAMSRPAVAEASDTKHIATAEPLSECNEVNAGEMGMVNSCLMPFGIMTGEAGKWPCISNPPNGKQATPVASQWWNRSANRLDRRGDGRVSSRLLHATQLGHGITAARPYILRTNDNVELGHRLQSHCPVGPQRSQLPIRESLRIACVGHAAAS